MNRLWKNFKTNFMYWRFRHLTRNRLRLQSWWYRRRQGPKIYRPRATATFVISGSRRRSWTALGAMVVALTILRFYGEPRIGSTFVYLLSSLIVIAALYWALRGV